MLLFVVGLAVVLIALLPSVRTVLPLCCPVLQCLRSSRITDQWRRIYQPGKQSFAQKRYLTGFAIHTQQNSHPGSKISCKMYLEEVSVYVTVNQHVPLSITGTMGFSLQTTHI